MTLPTRAQRRSGAASRVAKQRLAFARSLLATDQAGHACGSRFRSVTLHRAARLTDPIEPRRPPHGSASRRSARWRSGQSQRSAVLPGTGHPWRSARNTIWSVIARVAALGQRTASRFKVTRTSGHKATQPRLRHGFEPASKLIARDKGFGRGGGGEGAGFVPSTAAWPWGRERVISDACFRRAPCRFILNPSTTTGGHFDKLAVYGRSRAAGWRAECRFATRCTWLLILAVHSGRRTVLLAPWLHSFCQ